MAKQQGRLDPGNTPATSQVIRNPWKHSCYIVSPQRLISCFRVATASIDQVLHTEICRRPNMPQLSTSRRQLHSPDYGRLRVTEG